MNLAEQFETLDIPVGAEGKIFNGEAIPEYPNFRIAVDIEGYPVLLFPTPPATFKTPKNFKLRYLQLMQNVGCRITENNNVSFGNFSVVTFTSIEPFLQSYFLKIAETFVKSLSSQPSTEEIADTLNKFIEIFQSLSDAPTKTIQGLWAELLLIDSCPQTETLLSFWHNSPDDKFDFNSGYERIEVKSSSNFERKHSFSSEQLNPPNGTNIIVASTLVRNDAKGKNIQDLVYSISSKVSEIELIEKFNSIVCKTLGTSLEQAFIIKYDYDFSVNALKFYHYADIAKIGEQDIPNDVTNVRFTSNLSNINSVNVANLPNKGILFSSL
jgi:hypothetical protein